MWDLARNVLKSYHHHHQHHYHHLHYCYCNSAFRVEEVQGDCPQDVMWCDFGHGGLQVENDQERFMSDLRRDVQKVVGFDAVMRVRTSTGQSWLEKSRWGA